MKKLEDNYCESPNGKWYLVLRVLAGCSYRSAVRIWRHTVSILVHVVPEGAQLTPQLCMKEMDEEEAGNQELIVTHVNSF